MPKVTILMPVYNGEKYLKEAIDSILVQTYTDFDFLIVNDGSTDGTVAIVESYKDPRIRVHMQKNQGVARSLNQGIAMIDTKYIRRHDADDISEPNMLERQIQFLETHSEVKFVSTSCVFMTDRSKVANNYTQPRKKLFEANDFVLVDKKMFNPYSPIVHGTVLGPTAIFKEMGGYRTEFLTSEDNDLWLRIIEHYQFAVLEHTYYYLRLNATSATQVHKSSTGFYREMAMLFASERFEKQTDPLQRGESILKPKEEEHKINIKAKAGKIFRGDVLHFTYKVALNAKDYKNISKIITIALKGGWRLSRTWKAIIFPIFGKNLLNNLVKLKALVKW